MNAYTRHEQLWPRSHRARAAIHELRRTIEPAGVIVIDHLAPPAGCPCAAADPAYAEFRSSDDFANRARFLPCRAAWEVLCVDPDGTVHPVDYFQPALGSLLHTPLMALWNSDAAQRLRQQALHRISAEQRRACPY